MTHAVTYHASLGTVSHGTMRPEDLIEAFTDELDYHAGRIAKEGDKERADALYHTIDRITNGQGSDWDDGGEDSEDADDWIEEDGYVVEELMQELDNLAPPYCYFGAHEGDGSDYGFWVHWDSIDEDRRIGALPSGDELPDEADEGSLFLTISDHGNAELYQRSGGDWVSLWSV